LQKYLRLYSLYELRETSDVQYLYFLLNH